MPDSPVGPLSNEALLHQLGSVSDQVFWVLDYAPTARTRYLSPGFEPLFGRPISELMADHTLWLDSVLEEDKPLIQEVTAHWFAADAAAPVRSAEYRIRRADGVVRWVSASARAWRDETGRVVRLAGITQDVTARREIEAAAQQSYAQLQQSAASLAAERDRLAQLAQAVPGAIYTVQEGSDGSRSIDFGLEGLATLFGLDTQALATDVSLLASVIHPEDMAAMNEAIARAVQSRHAFRYEFRINHRTLGPRWLETHAKLVAIDHGGHLWHGATNDITERRTQQSEIQRLNTELEARVAQRTEALQEAVKELEAFTYTVSHDLRAPLRAIDGFSQAVQDDHAAALPDEGKRYLRIIRDSTKKMAQLIDDLLAFSRVGRTPLNYFTVDMNAVVKQCVTLLAPQYEGRNIEWRIAPLPPAHGDIALLRQVWVNLLSNAVKYSRGSDPAVIAVDSETNAQGRVLYRVKDNGAGFNMRYAHKLFGVFERLHRADEFEGTGVGLAIVQRIVKRHGGEAHADSEPGKGATFSFHLGSAPGTLQT